MRRGVNVFTHFLAIDFWLLKGKK